MRDNFLCIFLSMFVILCNSSMIWYVKDVHMISITFTIVLTCSIFINISSSAVGLIVNTVCSFDKFYKVPMILYISGKNIWLSFMADCQTRQCAIYSPLHAFLGTSNGQTFCVWKNCMSSFFKNLAISTKYTLYFRFILLT